MTRPSLALTCIAKNEIANVKRCLDSFSPLADRIIFVDTGSTDGTVQVAKTYDNVQVEHFAWVNDFAAARNYAASFVDTEYWGWFDLDDTMRNPEGFIEWRDSIMQLADLWLAPYNYTLDAHRNPTCVFSRERVFRTSKNLKWKYWVHEGVIADPSVRPVVNYTTKWAIDHNRTEEDLKADRKRNLSMLASAVERPDFDGRMMFYKGKEHYESQQLKEAYDWLTRSLNEKLETHDKLLAYQYAAFAALNLGDMEEGVRLAHEGLKLHPTRAELFIVIADAYAKCGQFMSAIPFYMAAAKCEPPSMNSPQAVFYSPQAYGPLPLFMAAQCYANAGRMDDAMGAAQYLAQKYGMPEAKALADHLTNMTGESQTSGEVTRVLFKKVDLIVFSCEPQTPWAWDGETYRTRGLGGSETACVEIAEQLAKLTGLQVIVFNHREKALTVNGVTYTPITEQQAFLSCNQPRAVIKWRHNSSLPTDKVSPTFVWTHDVLTPGAELKERYTAQLALTPFHRDFICYHQNLTHKDIILTRNGLSPGKLIEIPAAEKVPGKIVWSSSPDRGLLEAISVLAEVRKTHPEVTLDVFYGVENLRKYGMSELADQIMIAIRRNPWVRYHGFTEQRKMYAELKSACVWLYPTNFCETSCITAMEMLACGVYPVVRKFGALSDTLKDAAEKGMATLVDGPCITEIERSNYVRACVNALESKSWERVSINLDAYSWESIAKEWIEWLGL